MTEGQKPAAPLASPWFLSPILPWPRAPSPTVPAADADLSATERRAPPLGSHVRRAFAQAPNGCNSRPPPPLVPPAPPRYRTPAPTATSKQPSVKSTHRTPRPPSLTAASRRPLRTTSRPQLRLRRSLPSASTSPARRAGCQPRGTYDKRRPRRQRPRRPSTPPAYRAFDAARAYSVRRLGSASRRLSAGGPVQASAAAGPQLPHSTSPPSATTPSPLLPPARRVRSSHTRRPRFTAPPPAASSPPSPAGSAFRASIPKSSTLNTRPREPPSSRTTRQKNEHRTPGGSEPNRQDAKLTRAADTFYSTMPRRISGSTSTPGSNARAGTRTSSDDGPRAHLRGNSPTRTSPFRPRYCRQPLSSTFHRTNRARIHVVRYRGHPHLHRPHPPKHGQDAGRAYHLFGGFRLGERPATRRPGRYGVFVGVSVLLGKRVMASSLFETERSTSLRPLARPGRDRRVVGLDADRLPAAGGELDSRQAATVRHIAPFADLGDH